MKSFVSFFSCFSQDKVSNSFRSSTKLSLSSSAQTKVNTFLDYVWPIKSSESPKFFCITLIMFCILCIQNLIRALKDSIINTMIGTETVAFLKFWGVFPAAFLITIIYVKLTNKLASETIFYLIISVFLAFFALFAFYLFPNHQILHIKPEDAKHLVYSYPHLKWFILLLSNWSFSLFYIIAELWPNVVFALLFWQFVNSITNVEESRRFYPLFGLLGQTGLCVSGQFLMNINALNQYFSDLFNLQLSDNIVTIQVILSAVIIFGITTLIGFWFLTKKIITTSKIGSTALKSSKPSLTTMESFKMVLSSRYIMLITTLLVCYGIAINLVEGPWKASATKIYKTPAEFAIFIGSYLNYTGIFTLIFVIIGSNIVRKIGWLTAAMITPIMVLLTGIIFFTVSTYELLGAIITSIILVDPIMFVVAIGAIQNVLSKSSKYTLFDSTKEMSYVPLDSELKTKGKAAADMIGTKLGKSLSALLQSLIFVIVPTATYQSISVYLMIIFTAVCIVWIWAVKELNKEYSKLTAL
jgi:AAA family ATP:ADP antiporter